MTPEPQARHSPVAPPAPASKAPASQAQDAWQADPPQGTLAVVPQLPQPLPPPVMLTPFSFNPAAPDDAACFARAIGLASPAPANLDKLGIDLGALVSGGPGMAPQTWTFQLEVPGLGPLEGLMTVRDGKASLELHATRPLAAAALRSRQHELQQSIDLASQGDVSLFIV